MDARLSAEQAEPRDAAARLADDLGPRSVLDLSDADRQARLEKALASTGWRALRSDGAGGVEVALVAQELARGLVDVPFLGRVLADSLRRCAEPATIAVGGVAIDARDAVRALALDGTRLLSAPVGDDVCETAIQVHGGIGNTWECLAHVFLRRVLVNSELFPVRLEEIDVGLPGFGAGGGIPRPAAGMARAARQRVRDGR